MQDTVPEDQASNGKDEPPIVSCGVQDFVVATMLQKAMSAERWTTNGVATLAPALGAAATDGSFLPRSQTQHFSEASCGESRWLLEGSRRRLSGLRVPYVTSEKRTEFKLAV